MPRVHRAAWVLPIVTPPIRDGWVAVEDDRIVAVGAAGHASDDSVSISQGSWGPTPTSSRSATSRHARAAGAPPTLDRLAILPGLVNAHTHLELSWMRGRVPPADAMPDWASRVIGLRQSADGDARAPIVEAIREARATGTALVGDITNTLAAYDPLVESELYAAVFLELIGFRVAEPESLLCDAMQRLSALAPNERLRASIVPHAPYSVSPELMRAIATSGTHPISIHLAESREEIRFLHDGTGPWRELLERLGAWSGNWVPPGCGPVEYLDRLGMVSDRLVAVHGVNLTAQELARLAAVGAAVVTCPRSNRWTGAGEPSLQRFFDSGVRVALGTDSLASVDDLNLFNEMQAVRQRAPHVPARRILHSATLEGANVLGFGAELGSLEPGKRAELLGVRVPPDVEDVEEYLLTGVQPSELVWLPPR
jgi:cytosine/adenosine deaminase-related metal-dependent hydrolase